MVNNTAPVVNSHGTRSEASLSSQHPKFYKEKSFRESLTSNTTARPVLASKSLNSQTEPESVDVSNRKRPSSSISGFDSNFDISLNNAKRTHIPPSKRASLMDDIYLDNCEPGEADPIEIESAEELTEDDEANEDVNDGLNLPKVEGQFVTRENTNMDVAIPSSYKDKECSIYPRLNWHDMTEFDYPIEFPRQLPAIKEDSVFDIGPACNSISPPLYIPKFAAQVDFCRSQTVEEMNSRKQRNEPSEGVITYEQ